MTGSIEALKNMGAALEQELKSLLTYYGERVDTPDAMKPEDFFNLVASFSTSLQVCSSHSVTPLSMDSDYTLSRLTYTFQQKCAIEMHDYVSRDPTPKQSRAPSIKESEPAEPAAVGTVTVSPLHPPLRCSTGEGKPIKFTNNCK